MEAKTWQKTVMSDEQLRLIIEGNAPYTNLTGQGSIIVAKAVAQVQAEASFKAGEQESDKKWRQILKDAVALVPLLNWQG